MWENEKIYRNWFVVQVKTGREYFIKEFIENNADEPVKMFIFTRELLFERKKCFFKVISPLFPGYIFVYKKTKQVIDTLRTNLLSEFIRPICFKQKKCRTCFTDTAPCMVFEHEMEYLLDNSDLDGIFRLSKGVRLNEQVMITDGPLKNNHGDIVWINERKKKACVEIELFRRKMKVNLGIHVLQEWKVG